MIFKVKTLIVNAARHTPHILGCGRNARVALMRCIYLRSCQKAIAAAAATLSESTLCAIGMHTR